MNTKSFSLNDRNNLCSHIIYWYIIIISVCKRWVLWATRLTHHQNSHAPGHDLSVFMSPRQGDDGLPWCKMKSPSLCFYLDSFWCHRWFLVNLIIWSEHLNERSFSASILNKHYSCFWNPYERLCALNSCISFIGNEFVPGLVFLSEGHV